MSENIHTQLNQTTTQENIEELEKTKQLTLQGLALIIKIDALGKAYTEKVKDDKEKSELAAALLLDNTSYFFDLSKAEKYKEDINEAQNLETISKLIFKWFSQGPAHRIVRINIIIDTYLADYLENDKDLFIIKAEAAQFADTLGRLRGINLTDIPTIFSIEKKRKATTHQRISSSRIIKNIVNQKIEQLKKDKKLQGEDVIIVDFDSIGMDGEEARVCYYNPVDFT